MARAIFILFSIWFLILPFSALSSLYFSIADLAVDKIIAPVLVFIWIGLFLAGRYRLGRKKFLLLIHVFLFFIIRNISFIGDMALFVDLIWRDAIIFGYFALPVLYIDNLKRIDIAGKLISVNAVVACMSAFLVAFGIVELPYERFSESRIGFEDIKKSIGVLTSYGDVAQIAAFFLLLGLFMPEKIFSVGKRAQKIIKLSVLLIVIMGLIGNQSRSYLLSIIAAYVAALFFAYRSKKSTDTRLLDILAVLSAVFILPLMIFMLGEISSSLGGLGGREAQGSANARLQQFEAAFSLIRENPLFGVGPEFYTQYSGFAHGVHNMWLGQMTRGGIVSTLILFSLLFGIFRGCLQLFKQDSTKSYAIVLTGYMVAVFVSTLFYPADTNIFWALLGMSAAIIYSLNSVRDNIDNDVVHRNGENVSDIVPLESKILRKAEKKSLL